MQTGSVIRIEKNVDRAASAVLSLSCAYAVYVCSRHAGLLISVSLGVGVALIAYMVTRRLLGRVEPQRRELPVPYFSVFDFEGVGTRHLIVPEVQQLPVPDEVGRSQLLLTDGREARRVDEPEARVEEGKEEDELLLTERCAPPASPEEPLLLDDILAELEPESRVVRLFDVSGAPTPGQLKTRIDRHLDQSAQAAQSLDAAQALHEALAELRRSIR